MYQIKVIDQLRVNLQELRPLGSINRSLWWILIGPSGARLPTSPYVRPHPHLDAEDTAETLLSRRWLQLWLCWSSANLHYTQL